MMATEEPYAGPTPEHLRAAADKALRASPGFIGDEAQAALERGEDPAPYIRQPPTVEDLPTGTSARPGERFQDDEGNPVLYRWSLCRLSDVDGYRALVEYTSTMQTTEEAARRYFEERADEIHGGQTYHLVCFGSLPEMTIKVAARAEWS